MWKSCPFYEVLNAKIEDASLTYVAEIEHRALAAVVWGWAVPVFPSTRSAGGGMPERAKDGGQDLRR
jgi:hypothetical protein